MASELHNAEFSTNCVLSGQLSDIWLSVRQWSTSPWVVPDSQPPAISIRPLMGEASTVGSTRVFAVGTLLLYEELTAISETGHRLTWELRGLEDASNSLVGATFARYTSSLKLTTLPGNRLTVAEWKGEVRTEPHNIIFMQAALHSWFTSLLRRLQEYLSIMLPPQQPELPPAMLWPQPEDAGFSPTDRAFAHPNIDARSAQSPRLHASANPNYPASSWPANASEMPPLHSHSSTECAGTSFSPAESWHAARAAFQVSEPGPQSHVQFGTGLNAPRRSSKNWDAAGIPTSAFDMGPESSFDAPGLPEGLSANFAHAASVGPTRGHHLPMTGVSASLSMPPAMPSEVRGSLDERSIAGSSNESSQETFPAVSQIFAPVDYRVESDKRSASAPDGAEGTKWEDWKQQQRRSEEVRARSSDFTFDRPQKSADYQSHSVKLARQRAAMPARHSLDCMRHAVPRSLKMAKIPERPAKIPELSGPLAGEVELPEYLQRRLPRSLFAQ